MYSFAKLKNDCRIILFISWYYVQFLLVPLIFVLHLLAGIRDAFEDAYCVCKRAYFEHRMHYKGY